VGDGAMARPGDGYATDPPGASDASTDAGPPRPAGDASAGGRDDLPLDRALAAQPQTVARLPALPEGPSYRASDGSVFLCAQELIRVAPDRTRLRMLSVKCLGTQLLADGSLLVAGAPGLFQVMRDGTVALLADAPGANDLSVDRAGNVYFTSGGVHRLTPAGKHDVLTPADANGVEVDPGNRFLYVTGGKTITRYALPGADAPLTAGTDLAVDLPSPDGLAFDAQGRLWVALNAASKVAVFDTATGKELGRLNVPIGPPAMIVQNVTFGGVQNDELFVVGGNIAQNAVLLRFPVGVHGAPTNPGAGSYRTIRSLESVKETPLP
jgi:sugar lactone lactonase YvrE